MMGSHGSCFQPVLVYYLFLTLFGDFYILYIYVMGSDYFDTWSINFRF